MNIEQRIERAITQIGKAFKPVAVYVNPNGVWVDPHQAIAWGRLVGVYDARLETFDTTEFARDVFMTIGERDG